MYKIMWVPGTIRVIWDMVKERQLPLSAQAYADIASLGFDLKKWATDYHKHYQIWLEEDSGQVFDLHHEINQSVIEMLVSLNQNTEAYKVFYWFDIDRDKAPDFKWEHCPIANTPLKMNSHAVHANNRFLSEEFPLVMPG